MQGDDRRNLTLDQCTRETGTLRGKMIHRSPVSFLRPVFVLSAGHEWQSPADHCHLLPTNPLLPASGLGRGPGSWVHSRSD